jgi:dihydrofolate reductase
MRTLYSFITVSLDGYDEGPDAEFDWPVVDEEFNQFSAAQLNQTGVLVFGRRTYEGMAQYWTLPEAADSDPVIAPLMNSLPKIVVSRTLETADWANTRVVRDNLADEFDALKRLPGKAIAILGSSDLTVSLIRLGLVDELRIMVNPVVLGAGRSLLRTADFRINLRLLESRPFASGNVLLRYRPQV